MFSKKELRNEILKKRDAITKEAHTEKSNYIAQYVIGHSVFEESNVILLFASFRNEVDTANIFKHAIAAGKKVYYPKVLGKEMEFYRVESEDDFEEGRWGIREPKIEDKRKFIPKQDDDICVIMPGAVFDKNGNRIGYGGGYYDKFLKKIETVRTHKVGIGFACQVIDIEGFPTEEHDVTLDMLVTETGLYEQ
jgi:5-formyltetrahydrofolate cyclo-ligase